MILYSNLVLSSCHNVKYSPDNTYIYQLEDAHGLAWYIGSTKCPITRFPQHKSGGTKDTSQRLQDIHAMRILDICTEAARFHLEAYWIAMTPTAINTNKHLVQLYEFQSDPSLYPCLSQNTILRYEEKNVAKRTPSEQMQVFLRGLEAQ